MDFDAVGLRSLAETGIDCMRRTGFDMLDTICGSLDWVAALDDASSGTVASLREALVNVVREEGGGRGKEESDGSIDGRDTCGLLCAG